MEGEPKILHQMSSQSHAPYYHPPAFQPQLPVAYSQPQPQPQAEFGDYAPVQQQAVVTIEGSGATSLSPTNNCVICMSVFVCMCCCTSMGIVALVLALVARVFREDPSNAVKAVTFNRYAFRWAIAAIIAGIVIIVLRFIVCLFYMFSRYGDYHTFMNVVFDTFRYLLRQLVYNMIWYQQ